MRAYMTEEEIAEHFRQKEQLRMKAMAAAMAQASWEQFFQYFNFAEVSWLSKQYFDFATPEGDCISRDDGLKVATEWMKYRWGGEDRDLQSLEISEEVAKSALMRASIDHMAEFWTFPEMVAIVYHCQELHLEREHKAGFVHDDAHYFYQVYKEQEQQGAGLRARDLLGILQDLGFDLSTVKEQEHVIELLKEAKLESSGTLGFSEFLYIIRKLVDKAKVDERRREHGLIAKSGMSLEECEGWHPIFDLAAGGTGCINVQDLRTLFQTIGLSWGAEGNRDILAWIKDADENNNGEIDFGEFCCLTNKMWTNNFADIQRVVGNMTRALEAGKASPRPTVSGQQERQGATSPVRRRGRRSSWTGLLSDAVSKDLDPTSPKSKQLVDQFEEAMARRSSTK